MTKEQYRQQIREMLSTTDTIVDGETGQTIAEGADAFADMVKQDLTPELREAGFSTEEIEELFKPDRPAH